jgi:hypothetical protein
MVKYKSKSQRRQQKRINRVSVNSTCEHSDNTDNIFLATTHAEKRRDDEQSHSHSERFVHDAPFFGVP